jgi:hypothetical protein
MNNEQNSTDTSSFGNKSKFQNNSERTSQSGASREQRAPQGLEENEVGRQASDDAPDDFSNESDAHISQGDTSSKKPNEGLSSARQQ